MAILRHLFRPLGERDHRVVAERWFGSESSRPIALRFPPWAQSVGFLLFFSGAFFPAWAAPASSTREYDIKAAALYNIVMFVEWPPTAFKSEEAPLVIGLLGEEPFGDLIDHLVANESHRGRKLQIKRANHLSGLADAHVIFIPRRERGRWPQLAAELVKRPVLTVSDAENFAAHGGTVEFLVERNKLRIIANVAAAQAAGLTLSSKLLRLAEVIGEEKR